MKTSFNVETGELVTEPLTAEDIAQAEEVKTQSEQDRADWLASLNYAERRAVSYPPITDYLDGIVKGDQAQIDAYIQACLAVKAAHPKNS